MIFKWGTFSPFLYSVFESNFIISKVKIRFLGWSIYNWNKKLSMRYYFSLILKIILFSVSFTYPFIGGFSIISSCFLIIYLKWSWIYDFFNIWILVVYLFNNLFCLIQRINYLTYFLTDFLTDILFLLPFLLEQVLLEIFEEFT